MTLKDNEKEYLLTTARERILAQLERRQPVFAEPPDSLKARYGAFVTLHRGQRLRGCIGQMTGTMPLYEMIREMAISSAFYDPRFPPVSRAEFDELDIEISVLSPLEDLDDPSKLQPGVHGVYLQRGPYSGVLLPQVAVEQGWDREEFLSHTCVKAGMGMDCWKQKGTRIQVFTAVVFGEKRLNGEKE